MKRIILSILGIAIGFSLFALPINPEQAAKIAKNFYLQMSIDKGISSVSLTLAYTAKSLDISSAKGLNGQETPVLYVFNVNQSDGFVIVAADNYVAPVLGYSLSGSYSDSDLPPAFRKLIEKYKKEITDVILNNFQADQTIENEWKKLENGENISSNKGVKSVNPLLTTTWSQSPYVNAMCPYDAAAGSANGYHCVTGCPATAMAQIMKFWNYPTTGMSFHSYNHATYGTLSANFASTTYNWGSMPNNVSSANTAVATLMYHCGVAVNMNYGPTSSGGYVIINSPTPQANCEYAYKTYFGYNPSTIHGYERDNYSDASWKQLLKTDLDAGRPIQYAGFGQGGHTFVCDGYDNNDFFHMNWGWGGYCDGFFDLDALNPGTGGTGSGAGTYNMHQQAVFGIQPPSGTTQNYDLQLYSDISMPSTQIWFTNAFSLTVDIANFGTGSFSGQYGAAIFDHNYNFVDFMEIKTNMTLNSNNHYTNGLTFSNSGSAAFVPGTYYVAIFYKTTTNDWTIIGNGSYTNLKQFQVIYSSDIETNSAFTITTNGGRLIQGQSATVNVDLKNTGSSTFYGQFRVNLANLDGTWAQNIQILNESNGLPYNYHYTNGNNFTGNITVAPGTYLMEVAYQSQGSSSWYYAGSSNYSNPIYVIVVSPSLQPDIYEQNNTEGTAYNLSLNFSSGTATKNTNGSNIHIGSDLDYYKIVLPTGFNYSINARVHDSYNSGNGQTYTGDVMFSYKYNSVWSDNYDDIMPSNINIVNGGTVIFNVAPYFAGETGTYLLDMTITQTVGINEIEALSNSITLYPNPANEFVNIDLKNCEQKVNKINLFDNIGREIRSFNLSDFSDKVFPISVSALSDGLYFVNIQTDKYAITKKLNIQK